MNKDETERFIESLSKEEQRKLLIKLSNKAKRNNKDDTSSSEEDLAVVDDDNDSNDDENEDGKAKRASSSSSSSSSKDSSKMVVAKSGKGANATTVQKESVVKALPTATEIINGSHVNMKLYPKIRQLVHLLSLPSPTKKQLKTIEQMKEALNSKQTDFSGKDKMYKKKQVRVDSEDENQAADEETLEEKDRKENQRIKKEWSSFAKGVSKGSDLFHGEHPFSGLAPHPKLSPASYQERNKILSNLVYNLVHSQSRFFEKNDTNRTGQYRTVPDKDMGEREEGDGDETVGLVAAMMGQLDDDNELNVSKREVELEKCCIFSAAYISKFLWDQHRKTENNKIDHQRRLLKQQQKAQTELPADGVAPSKKRKWARQGSIPSKVTISNVTINQNGSCGDIHASGRSSRYGNSDDRSSSLHHCPSYY